MFELADTYSYGWDFHPSVDKKRHGSLSPIKSGVVQERAESEYKFIPIAQSYPISQARPKYYYLIKVIYKILT